MPRLAFCCVSITLVLLTAVEVAACPSRSIGLEALIEQSDQAILVEIVEVEPSSERLTELVAWLRSVTGDVPAKISPDFAWWSRSVLTEDETGKAVMVASARVLETLDQDGPPVDRVFRWDIDSPIAPGRFALLFLTESSPAWSSGELTLLDATDAALLLPDSLAPDELARSVQQGFANLKRHGHVATDRWLDAAIRSPVTRPFLLCDGLAERGVPADVIANALLDEPSGTWVDLDWLSELRDVPDSGLDLLALEWVEALLTIDNVWMANRATAIAADRWGLDIDDPSRTPSIDDVRRAWMRTAEKDRLPRPDAQRLRERAEGWHELSEQVHAVWVSFRR